LAGDVCVRARTRAYVCVWAGDGDGGEADWGYRDECAQVATEFQTKVLTKKQLEEAKTAKRAAKRHKAKLAKQRVREVRGNPKIR
jgi:hypothetical protein